MNASRTATFVWQQPLEWLIVRKDDLLCTRCGEMEPVHPGYGTPAAAFIAALYGAASRHRVCSPAKKKKKKKKKEMKEKS